jgi:hypothetical protein
MRLTGAGLIYLLVLTGWCSGGNAQAVAQGPTDLPADASGPMVIVGALVQTSRVGQLCWRAELREVGNEQAGEPGMAVCTPTLRP